MSEVSGDILATVSAGNSVTQLEVPIVSATPIIGTFVPLSPAGSVGANPLVVYNWDPLTQLGRFLAAEATGRGANIVTIGDSITVGFGAAGSGFRELSYAAELTQALNADGVAAQSDNFDGQGNENGYVSDQRIAFLGGAHWAGVYDAGGQTIETSAVGDGFTFTLNTPADYDRVTLSYVDRGGGTLSVSVDGNAVGTVTLGNGGETLSQTISIPAGLHGAVTVTADSAAQTFIQGVSFANATSGAVQIFNAGIGGWGAGNANSSVLNGQLLTGSTEGIGQVAGAVALAPQLAIVDLGVNDLTGADNLGVPVDTATIMANLEQIVATLRAAGSDVILVIPGPISNPGNPDGLAALRAALQTYSLAANVPLIDLDATYGSFSALNAAGLMSGGVHPNATLYADIGSQLAALLANATTPYNAGMADTEQGTAGNDTLRGVASVNTLIGAGGHDVYQTNASDQSDTIVNGLDGDASPSGTLDLAGLTHDQLWLTRSGDNLVLSVLGSERQFLVENWFAGAGGRALASLKATDGTLGYADVAALVAAMAGFTAANPGFDPATSSATSLLDPLFGPSLQTALATAWDVNPACFCAGTRIATPRGEVEVERLAPGDEVLTLHGGVQRIRWIGRRRYSAAFANANRLTAPVRLAAGALEPGVPARPLCLSPGHAVCIDGVLIHAWRLLNSGSITQPRVSEPVRYFHVELDTHEVIFAEGCPVESFRDEAFRACFENAAAGARLAGAVEPPACLPQLIDGFQLEAIRARLARRAGLDAAEPPPGPLLGYIDGVSPHAIYGWAQDRARPEQPVCLAVFAGGQKIASVIANRYRADLREAGFGSGLHGFHLELPPGVGGPVEIRRARDGARLRYA